MAEVGFLLCYNKGCGKSYNPEENNPDSCTYHPGAPVFHDAYKGWSCCRKKCTDFTEFLNIKGCTRSYHSNEKPIEPEKPIVNKELAAEVIEVRPPQLFVSRLPRPSINSPLRNFGSSVSNLESQLEDLVLSSPGCDTEKAVPLGTICKNGGCKISYEEAIECKQCVYHPGQPVFHEGLKFWSCCNKITTDFNSFLEQVGCKSGEHKWTVDLDASAQTSCRLDWHQTSTHVIVSIYARKYDQSKSVVQLNPILLRVNIFFPESRSRFKSDTELQGIIDEHNSEVIMFPTKIEVKMRKAEPWSWTDLALRRDEPKSAKEEPVSVESEKDVYDDNDDDEDLMDFNVI